MTVTNERLIGYLEGSLGLPRGMSPETPLFSNGALDSLAMLDLIAFVEESTGAEVRTEDVTLENFDTPARIVRYVESRV